MADDFRGDVELENFRYYLKAAAPERELVRLDLTHPVFGSFYAVDLKDLKPPYGDWKPEFWGMSDEHGRLQLIANYNNDLGEFWQWVDQGEMPFHPAARSVMLGINYVIYAMTH